MSKLILGTVQMGLNYGINNFNGKVTTEESFNILKNAYKFGIRTLDTAEAYGDAHQIIGNYHNENPKFKIITKFPQNINKKDNLEGRVLDYIYDLNVDSIEVLMFHSFESYINNKDSINNLVILKNQGLVKNIGVSVYKKEEIKFLINDIFIDVIQLPFNLLDNYSIKGNLIREAKVNKKTIHSRSAFLQGLFFMHTNNSNYLLKELKDELDQVKNIAINEKCSITELALSYCINQSEIDNVIIGVDSVQQLNENFKASLYKIKQVNIDKINKLIIDNVDLLNPSLWKKKLF